MALPVIAVVRTVDSDRITHPLGAALVAEVKEHDVALVVFLALAVLGGKIVQAFTEQRITNQTAVKAVLDSAHKVYFVDVAKVDQEQLYQHRVTLFKARRHLRDLGLNPLNWKNWKRALSVQCRSGTTYQHSSMRLRIDDDNEAANEGVAGRAWFTNAAVTVSLPEWPEDATGSDDPRCVEYARLGFMSVKTASSVTVKSRSLSAHVVRTKTGVRWGVLVFDSRDPNGVSNQPERRHIMELSAHLLSQLL